MPRLESAAKAGYYPTPPHVAAAIAHHLMPTRTGSQRILRLLDPCAGTGEAAATVSRALGAESYGIELNDDRAKAAHVQLDHVLATSAFSVRLAHGAFSCLYLNPPYAEDEDKRRLEHAFLTSLTRALCPTGVLVFLVPQRRLAVSARYLASHFENLALYRFPDPEFAAFRQVVLFATRKRQAALDPVTQAKLQAWSEGELIPLPDEPAPAALIPVPALPAGDVLFAPLFFDPAAAAVEAHRRGVWTHPDLVERLWPAEAASVRPLMPLRRGHLALLVAAGLLNNVTLEQDGQRVLVKGRTTKVMQPVETEDTSVQVEREVLRTVVTLLDLATGRIEVIEQGRGSPRSEAD